jgi:carotenoid cleavage dioxygenase-like enzyme
MPAHNRFLEGSFAPVTEEITAFDLPVTGQVPAGLSGRYLRNGPNPLGLDDPQYHWFLGAGMVHGVRLRDGKAEWYRNRWVRSKAVAVAHGQQWPGGPVHENMDFAANTHIIAHGGRTLATVEAGPLPYEMSEELDTIAPATSAGHCPAASPRTPSSTIRPANCTPSPTSGPGTTSSTSWSTQAARSSAPPTSPSPTAR